jgi:serine/threonine protein kinase
MEQRTTKPKSRKPVVFRDGLGRRVRTLDSAGSELEVLCLRPELSTATHEAALRERVTRLANVRGGSFARVRAVQRLNDSASTLALVSTSTPGMRLSEMLSTSERLSVALDGSAGWAIVMQLVSAVALLHEHAPDVAHGAIAPERIVVTPDARVVLVEHVLGSMLEPEEWSPERLWKEQRIAVPAGATAFDLRTDVTQVGVVALSLVLGRSLRDDEYPSQMSSLVGSAAVTSVTGDREPMSEAMRSWLDRALQLDDRRSFASGIEASAELYRLLEETESVVVPLSLEAFLSRLQTAIERDRQSAPAASSAPSPAVEPAAAVEPAPPVESAPVPEPKATPFRNNPTPIISFAIPSAAQIEAAKAVAAVETTESHAPETTAPSVANPAFQSLMSATAPARESSSAADVSFQSVEPAKAGGSFWKDRPWSRQAAAAAVLTVLVGAGWAFTRTTSEVRAEPSQPLPSKSLAVADVPAPPPAYDPPVPASQPLPEVAIKTAAAVTTTTAPAAAVAPAAAPAPAPVQTGWVTINAAYDLNVFENGNLIGTTKGGRIRLPVGSHQLQLVSDAIGYRGTQSVQVKNNATQPVSVDLPNGVLSLNATPWAEVVVDGKSVGETPIGNLSVALGSHDVVFRHPELGEKRMTATVTLSGPTRLSADLRK